MRRKAAAYHDSDRCSLENPCGERNATHMLLWGECFVKSPKLTAEEFERQYAGRGGITVEELHEWGRYPEPCDCGEDICEGWAMGFPWEDAIFEDGRRGDSRLHLQRTILRSFDVPPDLIGLTRQTRWSLLVGRFRLGRLWLIRRMR